MTILITAREPNRADAERCAMWLLIYYREQAERDGIPPAAVGASMAKIDAIRAELAGARPGIWAERL